MRSFDYSYVYEDVKSPRQVSPIARVTSPWGDLQGGPGSFRGEAVRAGTDRAPVGRARVRPLLRPLISAYLRETICVAPTAARRLAVILTRLFIQGASETKGLQEQLRLRGSPEMNFILTPEPHPTDVSSGSGGSSSPVGASPGRSSPARSRSTRR